MVILARRPVARSRRFNKVTFFHEGPSEFRTVQPVAQAAQERGYEVSFSQDPQVPADIGVSLPKTVYLIGAGHFWASSLSNFSPYGADSWMEVPIAYCVPRTLHRKCDEF
jgi:hypothetical protein